MLSTEQFLWGGILCAKILLSPIFPPPSPRNTKDIMESLNITNITKINNNRNLLA